MSDYLSVENLRAMSPNEEIAPVTVLPLAEEHARFKAALEEIAAMRTQSWNKWWKATEVARLALKPK